MDFKDGSEKWETFIMDPFLKHLRDTCPVTDDPKRTFLMGASMGGMGSLRMAFRYPDKFGAVAALEPGIEPILKWEEMRLKHRFWREGELFERTCGKPVDPEFWAANNPATIVIQNAEHIRGSRLQIYIEAGDEDQFWLYEGTEFLHQVLWDQKIKHEYHLVRGADHIGPSMGERQREAIEFLARTMHPWGPPAAEFEPVLKLVEAQKAALDEKDHYNEL
jgi:S-formylglutathione hydrolase